MLTKQTLINLLMIIAVAIIIFLSYQYWHVNEDVKSSKARIEAIEETFDNYRENAEWEIEERDITILELKKQAKEDDSLSKEQLASADRIKKKYETLKNSGYRLAKTTEDSLEVCLNVSDEMFKEATHLRDGLDKAYEVIRVQTKAIDLLEQNVEEYKQLLTNADTMNTILEEHIKLLERKAKSDKLKAGGIGVGIGTGLGIIIMLLLI